MYRKSTCRWIIANDNCDICDWVSSKLVDNIYIRTSSQSIIHGSLKVEIFYTE